MNSPNNAINTLGTNLRYIRESRSLCRSSFSRLIGYDRVCYGKLEYGEQAIRLHSLISIARKLDLDVSSLLSSCFTSDDSVRGKTFRDADYINIFLDRIDRELENSGCPKGQVNSSRTREHISRLINGKIGNPSINELDELAVTFGLTLTEIFK